MSWTVDVYPHSGGVASWNTITSGLCYVKKNKLFDFVKHYWNHHSVAN
jgi:hypothetical protein